MTKIEKPTSLSRRDFIRATGLISASALLAACNYPQRDVSPLPTLEPSPSPFSPLPPTQEVPTVEPSATPDTRSYFEKYVYPALYEVADRRREEKAEADPDYWQRVDRELNEGRINFIILGKGSERVLTDSMQMMSLDIETNEIRIVAVPRGVSVPEVSRYLGNNRVYMANQAHINGGMPLMEKVLEDATGLSCDFVVLVDMEFLIRAVENLYDNQLEVCVPWEIDDLNMGYFRAGLQTLNGEELLRLSRARYYANYVHRDIVQQYVLKAMLRRARQEFAQGALAAAGFLGKGLLFFQREQSAENIQTNFDSGVFIDIFGQLVRQLATNGTGGEASGFGMPSFAARYEFTTENNWFAPDTTRRRPPGGDPLAEDLVSDYWFASRAEVRDFITGNISGTGFEAESEVCGVTE
ncbi:hypothetical protein A2V61_00130 [Candidatus Woesebacteria bacterium RBG_19FT_COMBO_47_8]|uniref:Cell envelope-related transcriptional attenuator domain-containing protein n=1 Tax=Candidatus Woesebacteria bacterium RBG_13_46_13 TaxID=1802479 RepID=A0A1F7X4P7_9BACT|nr:MAG: hypothetical protein A2Y68_03645 [Candidatus Woesebacteria bacterium RBG_13_46_13]OGM17865.1 MAG: hypothetical protein A2V61_00130 [Candidatus Woesebacteria bacterium RBG_19FT_COMBO_47_8]HJX59204.1 LCP family protein [Patescibacteria group bacterium]